MFQREGRRLQRSDEQAQEEEERNEDDGCQCVQASNITVWASFHTPCSSISSCQTNFCVNSLPYDHFSIFPPPLFTLWSHTNRVPSLLCSLSLLGKNSMPVLTFISVIYILSNSLPPPTLWPTALGFYCDQTIVKQPPFVIGARERETEMGSRAV